MKPINLFPVYAVHRNTNDKFLCVCVCVCVCVLFLTLFSMKCNEASCPHSSVLSHFIFMSVWYRKGGGGTLGLSLPSLPTITSSYVHKVIN